MSIRLTEARLRQIIREEIKGMRRLRETVGADGVDRWWKSLAAAHQEAATGPGQNQFWQYDGWRMQMQDAMKRVGIPAPNFQDFVARYGSLSDRARNEYTKAFEQIYQDHAEELEAAHDEKWMAQDKKQRAERARSASAPPSQDDFSSVRGTPAEKAALKKLAKHFAVYGWYKQQVTPGNVSPGDGYHAAYQSFDNMPESLAAAVAYGDDLEVEGDVVLLMQRLGIDTTPFTTLPDYKDWDERMSWGDEYEDESGGYVRNKFLKRSR